MKSFTFARLRRECSPGLLSAAIGLALLCGAASAQGYGDYPPGYPFGQNGDPSHPNGYDAQLDLGPGGLDQALEVARLRVRS